MNILNFQHFYRKALNELRFFEKLRNLYYRAATLSRRQPIIHFFLKIFFLKQLFFSTYSTNNLWLVLFIAKLQTEHCKNSIIEFFLRKFSFCNQLFFATFSFIKNQITWKPGKEKLGKGRLFDFFTLFLKIKHLL